MRRNRTKELHPHLETLEERRLFATISFEEPIPSPGDVVGQYGVEGDNNFGVRFSGERLSVTVEGNGNHVLEQIPITPGEFVRYEPMEMGFTTGQEFISLHVGGPVGRTAKLFTFDSMNPVLGSTTPEPIGPVGLGVSAQDDATGTGFILFTEQAAAERFSPPPTAEDSDHLVVVKNINGQWFYDDNISYQRFTPRLSDVLLAQIDFTNDTVTDLRGQDEIVEGIAAGYAGGDLTFRADFYNGQLDDGDFGVEGTHFYRKHAIVTLDQSPQVRGVEIDSLPKFTPPLTLGDREFGGNGPRVDAEANLRIDSSGRHLEAQIYMKADEVEPAICPPIFCSFDQTTAEGASEWTRVYTAPPGLRITAITSDTQSSTSYTDEDHEDDVITHIDFLPDIFDPIQGDLVESFTFVGDTDGDEAGTRTGVTVDFQFLTEIVTESYSGVAVQDNATGTGYLMYSSSDVHSRFSGAAAPHPENHPHFIAVRNVAGQWQYDNDSGYQPFTPQESDLLVAEIDFSNRVISDLVGQSAEIFGIPSGYLNGDLQFAANQFNGVADSGEYDVVATEFARNEELLDVASVDFAAAGRKTLRSTSPDKRILSAVVTTEDGSGNHAPGSFMDNVLFSHIGPPLFSIPNDSTPPVVTIRSPGAVISYPREAMRDELAYTIRDSLTGILEIEAVFFDDQNAELSSVVLCGGAGLPACTPFDEPPFVLEVVDTGSRGQFPEGAASVEVRATDFAGNVGTDRQSFTRILPGPNLNLYAQAMEITQATQPWLPVNTQTRAATIPEFRYPALDDTSGVPLVAQRKTVVRVFGGAEGSANNVDVVGARALLRCFEDSVRRIPCDDGPAALYPVNGEVTIAPGDTLDERRSDADLSWNFVLPDVWTEADRQYHFEAEILPPLGIEECDGCNDGANRLQLDQVFFHEVPRFDELVSLSTVRVVTDTQTFEAPTMADMASDLAFLAMVLPIDESTVHAQPDEVWTYQTDALATMPNGSPDVGARRSAAVDRYRKDHQSCTLVDGFNCDRDGSSRAWHGIFPSQFAASGVSTNYGFLGDTSGYSISTLGWDNSTTTGHEIGHSAGRQLHAGPNDPTSNHNGACTDGQRCDDDWPWPHGTIGAFGFDTVAMRPIVPGNPIDANGDPDETVPHDFMSYGGNEWISPRNWRRLFDRFTGRFLPFVQAEASAGPAPSGENEPVSASPINPRGAVPMADRALVVSGQRNEAGVWSFHPAYELSLDKPQSILTPDSGEYLIELLDEKGRVLTSVPFDPPILSDAEEDAPLSFEVVLPMFDRPEAVVLKQGENELARLERSPSAPDVELASPTANGFLSQQVTWSASDTDGDPLTYWVQYSDGVTDGVRQWRSLGVDLDSNELAVELSNLAGSDDARVRVLATDGLNTTEVESPSFVVAPHAPVVLIAPGSVPSSVLQGTPLLLEARGSDLEEGALPADAFRWTSSLDGELGQGQTIYAENLSQGTHTIRVVAADASGMEGSDEVILIVERGLNAQPVANAGPDLLVPDTATFTLDGTQSVDPDGDRLFYRWSIEEQPPGSFPALANPNGAQPRLHLRNPGTYVIQLVVHDGKVASMADRLTIEANSSLVLAGDLDASGRVDQRDLDLVLLNWGAPAEPPPASWVNGLPDGIIGQAELDQVLLNWGAMQLSQSPPQPAAVTLTSKSEPDSTPQTARVAIDVVMEQLALDAPVSLPLGETDFA
jgi:hypothetical protein